MNESELDKSSLEQTMDKVKNAVVNFLVPLVALVLIVVMFFAMILPSVRSLPDLRTELDEKKTLNATLKTKVDTLNKLVDYQDIVSENSELINKVIVSDAEPLALQDQVYQIAQSSGLEVTKLSYSAGARGDTSEGSYNSVSIALGGTGVYEQIITFMDLVENAARFLSVKGVRYSTSDKDGNTILSIDLSVESPYMKIESKAVTDDPIGLNIASDDFVDFMNIIKEMQYYEFSPDSPVVPEEIVVPAAEVPGEEPVLLDEPGVPAEPALPTETPEVPVEPVEPVTP